MLENKLKELDKELDNLRAQGAQAEFSKKMQNVLQVAGVPVLSAIIPNADADALRSLTDQFRQQHPSGVVVLGKVNQGKPMLIAAVTPDLIARGIKAGDLIKRCRGCRRRWRWTARHGSGRWQRPRQAL